MWINYRQFSYLKKKTVLRVCGVRSVCQILSISYLFSSFDPYTHIPTEIHQFLVTGQ